MEKIDFKKELKDLYRASTKKISYIDVPKLKYLMVDGKGYPEKSPDFQPAIEALYGTAYTIKFMLKDKNLQPADYFDFVVPPLESLWWMDGTECFDPKQSEKWRWTLMVMQADYITEDIINQAKEEQLKKREVAYLDKLRFIEGPSGKAAQIMHIGPYNEVDRSTQVILDDFENKGYTMIRKHQELYLSDPRRVAPERLKTIVRSSG